MPTFRAFRFAVLAALVAFVSLPVHASNNTRISVIDPNNIAAIPGNISPRLAAAKDMGLAPAGQQIQHMSLRFNMTDAQQASLSQLLANLQNPSSPQFHQWLTPEQFAAQFGLAQSDIAQISQWLTAQGFTITSVGRGGEFIEFSGTIGQANQAFHTQLHTVQLGTETHIANYTAPMLPQAIAGVTSAVTGLTDFKMKPHVISRVIPAATSEPAPAASVHPGFYSSASGNNYVAPGDFYTIYDESAALTAGYNGTGIKIAVVGQTDVYSNDIATFRSVSSLSANPYSVTLDGTDPGYSSNQGDITESELDLEWVGVTAPSASIIFVNSTDVIDGSLTYAVDQNLAPIITDSYGDCEPDLGQANLAYYQTMLQMAASEGITVVAAAGDAGATDCDAGVASDGVAIDWPSDSPYVTGVGGTEFNEGAATSTYWGTTNNSNQGSALSYIPEMAWNDSVAGINAGIGLAAGGGGASAYFTKPSWQIGTGVPNDNARDTPDIALNASPLHDPYIMCFEGSCVTGYRESNGTLYAVGGTSVGAPTFAGLLSLVEQKAGGGTAARIGVANPTIYALANSTTYAGHVFHDTPVGSNNASPCTAGTTDCNAINSGYYSSLPCVSTTANCNGNLLLAYSTTLGYDQATGWGSVDAFNMISDWALVTAITTTGGATSSYTALSGSASSVVQGNTVTMTATVTSSSTTVTTTPTGTVQFLVDGVTVGTPVALVSGVATYSLSTTPYTIGVHSVQAAYSGNTTYAGSKGAFTLNVTSASAPDFSISPGTTSVTATHGQAAPGVVFTIAALNGFTGNVSLNASASSSLAAEYSFTVNPVTLSTSTTSAQTTLNLFAYTPAVGISPAQRGIFVKAANQSVTRGTIALEAGLSLAGVLLLVMLPRRRKFAGLVLALLALVTVGISGCSGGTSAASATGGTIATSPGTYTVTVSATGTVNSQAVTHTATVTFIVQ